MPILQELSRIIGAARAETQARLMSLPSRDDNGWRQNIKTMTDKEILSEIKKRYFKAIGSSCEFTRGRCAAYREMMAFIDSEEAEAIEISKRELPRI